MSKRPTISDLAREAGLGVATVDRALNGRANVSARAVARVAEAAERLGYHASGLARYRADASARPAVRLGFVLQNPRQAFYQAFSTHIEKAVEDRSDVRGAARVTFPDTQSTDDYCDTIEKAAGRSDALAIVAPNHPRVASLVQQICASGVPVFTLLNDVAQEHRTAYFGTDNIKIGRIAAWMLTTYVREPGELAVFVGSGRWYGHMMRETGFQGFLRHHASGFQLLDSIVNVDKREVTYEATIDLLNRRPDLRGIYVAGGGMEGAIAALREVRPPGRVGLVVNELTPESKAALIDRYVQMVIASPLEDLCRQCVAAMIDAPRNGDVSGQVFLGPDLFVPESI